jgi:putative ABC transport system ATP-binding protein
MTFSGSFMHKRQQQRVSIARALINKPRILFADEPCANLGTATSRNILELFRNLNRDLGQIIVMVSHEAWHTEYFDRASRSRTGRWWRGERAFLLRGCRPEAAEC